MTERIDQIGFGGLRLIQEPAEFCYGVDAVILADFAARQGGFCEENFEGRPIVPKRRGSQDCRAVDLGTGTGIIPLILSYKTTCSRLVGVEIQAGSCARAARSAELESLYNALTVSCAAQETNWHDPQYDLLHERVELYAGEARAQLLALNDAVQYISVLAAKLRAL